MAPFPVVAVAVPLQYSAVFPQNPYCEQQYPLKVQGQSAEHPPTGNCEQDAAAEVVAVPVVELPGADVVEEVGEDDVELVPVVPEGVANAGPTMNCGLAGAKASR